MPPGGKVVLVRPDGSLIQASPEQAENLKLLGYREEHPEERASRSAETAKEAYYTTPSQQVRAGGAALVRGATLGASDYLLGDDDTAARAKYNPGTSVALEALGALAPLVLSGGATAPEEAAVFGARAAARLAPTALLSRGAGALAEGLGIESRLARSAAGGIIEGAGYGGAAAANHTYLSGDPITAETVLHGAKWGAIFGGGLGVVGEGATMLGERAATSLATQKAAAAAAQHAGVPAAEAVSVKVGQESFKALRSEVTNLSEKLAEATKTADAVISGTANKLIQLGESAIVKKGAVRVADDAAAGGFSNAVKGQARERLGGGAAAAEEAGAAAAPSITTGELATIRQEVQRAARSARLAANAGDAAAAEKAIARYEKAVNSASEKLGATQSMGNPANAFRELIEIKAATKAFNGFPRSIEEFAAMKPERAEKLFAALDHAKKLSIYPEAAKNVEAAVGALSESLGIKASGLDGLRNAYASSKELLIVEKAGKKAAAKAAVKAANPPAAETAGGGATLGLAGNVLTYGAGRAIAGPGLPGAAATWGIRKLLSGETLAAMRNAGVQRLREAAAKYAPAVGSAIKRVGARVEPLAVKLDGTYDNSNKPREDLAAARVREFWDASPTINDRLYKGVEAVGITQPELGPAVHAAGVAAFRSMLSTVPRDPGVVSGLKSIWKPSMLQAEVLSRRLEVFHDPIGQAELMLSTGNFDPIKIKTLRDVAPAIYSELRQGVLERISEPGMMEKMTYNQQIGIGTMLDLPVHSSMRPEHIASSQQLFLVRNQPLPMPVQGGEGKNGGRPSATDNANATKSQKITDR